MAGQICYCGQLAKVKTSWTDGNSARRFFGCQSYEENGGCGFFSWLDPPMCERSKNVIPGLLRSIRSMEEAERKANKRERKLRFLLIASWVMFIVLWIATSGSEGKKNEM
ncbi:hypothetical protein BUALT_Bualt05G0110900 [Buddleja alternifolia]|uniref:GRF-type domain-containing protein n=1 Tax=Buddleja alternifolia TaxID=168488 RepID=A0AAV6XID9_9LAMI|nr:hypothetical protein BUALT_Bualt05G0110900 [Buddleja alternifolia]